MNNQPCPQLLLHSLHKLTTRGAATLSKGSMQFGSRRGTRCFGSAELATMLWSHSAAAAARRKRCTCGSGAAEVSMMFTCSQSPKHVLTTRKVMQLGTGLQ